MATQYDDRELVGYRVVSSDNEDVGTVNEVFIDEQTRQPVFVSVKGGMFGLRERMVPLQGARIDGEQVQVPYDQQRIKDAPNTGPADGTTPRATAELCRHYGISAADLPGQRTGESPTGDRGAAGEHDEIVVTRSEEEMHVGTERRESDRVHVRKRVETEQVERTVPTSHEEIHVDREPITGGEPANDAVIGEEDQEITLHEERPVASTEAVPVERIHVSRTEVQDEQTVRGEVRKEHIDITHDAEAADEPPDRRS